MSWTVHLEGGPSRVNHAAALVGDYIFSFGGYCNGENYRKRRPIDIHVLCTDTYRWRRLDLPLDPDDLINVPYQRYGHTVVAHGTNIYLWGGRNDTAACYTLYCFDTVKKAWKCPVVSGTIPPARDGHTSCVIGDKMYVFGGFVDDTDEYAEGLHALDLKTMNWKLVRTKGDPPTYRDFHSATCCNDKMFVFGGRGDRLGPLHTQQEVYSNILHVYDPERNTWTHFDSPKAPVGRRSLSSFSHNGNFYIFGGYNGNEGVHFNDLYCFDTRINEWSEPLVLLGDNPCRRRRQVCIMKEDKMFLFGGTSPTNDPIPVDEEDDFENPAEINLLDHDDLYVLDFRPTLKTLCLMVVIKEQINTSLLPKSLQLEIFAMSESNTIHTRAATRPSTG